MSADKNAKTLRNQSALPRSNTWGEPDRPDVRTERMRKSMKGNLVQTSPENTKRKLEDADMFLKKMSEETQDQQTKDKIERWMAQVRVDRAEEVTQRSTDLPREFLSAAQVEMQKKHVQMQKNHARVSKLHARTQNLHGVPSAIITEHAVRALQAVEQARKSAECSQTQRDVESRRRSWGSTAALSSTSTTIREGRGAFILAEKASARGEEVCRQSPRPSSPRHTGGVFKVGTDLLDTLVLTSAALRAGIPGGQEVAIRDRELLMSSTRLDDDSMMRLLLEQEGRELRAGMADPGLDYFSKSSRVHRLHTF